MEDGVDDKRKRNRMFKDTFRLVLSTYRKGFYPMYSPVASNSSKASSCYRIVFKLPNILFYFTLPNCPVYYVPNTSYCKQDRNRLSSTSLQTSEKCTTDGVFVLATGCDR